MKPTLSYVRGLRDVLEIPTREDRRKYIEGKLAKDLFVSRAMIDMAIPLLPGVGGFLAWCVSKSLGYGHSDLAAIAVASMLIPPTLYTIFKFDSRTITPSYQSEMISEISILQKMHKSQRRARNDFPESKLALDNFP